MRSKLSLAREGSPSVRTTIPEGVVSALKLKPGDEVEWEIEVRKDGLIAIIKKRAE